MEDKDPKSIWNNNNEETRDLNSLEKAGIEKLREKDPVYASFVERHLPLLDASIRFIDKTIADAKSKLEENKKTANNLKDKAKDKAKENKDENGKEAPEPMIYDEKFADGLIKEGEMLKGKVSGDIVSLSQAIISGERTVSRVTYVTAAAEIPKINPNEDKDKDKDKNNNEGENKAGTNKDKDSADTSPYKKEEYTPEGKVMEQDKSAEKTGENTPEEKTASPKDITNTNKRTLSKEEQDARTIAEKSGILKNTPSKTKTNSNGLNKENTNSGNNINSIANRRRTAER